MWKCVKCETNNPDYSWNCFICGTEKSYSLYLVNKMMIEAKAAEVAAVAKKLAESEKKTEKPVKGDIFGDAVYTKTHDPSSGDSFYRDEVPPVEESASPELYDYERDDDFLDELEREKLKEKRDELEREKRKKTGNVIKAIVLIIL